MAAAVAAAAAAPAVFAQAELTPREIASLAQKSVVTVTAYAGGEAASYGSGFMFEPDGVIATSLHVVSGADSVSVELEDGVVYDDVRVLGHDKRRDIVILKIPVKNRASLAVGSDTDMEVGDRVYVMGNPLGLSKTFSDGLLSAKRVEADDVTLQITAPISEGSSGGPVLNARGEVIGIAASFYVDGQNLNMAIPARYAKDLAHTGADAVPYAESSVAYVSPAAIAYLDGMTLGWPDIMATLPARTRRELEKLEPWEQQVAARRIAISSAVQAAGWQEWAQFETAYLATGEQGHNHLFLPAGSYQAFAVCDDDCWDLDLSLLDENGNVIAADILPDAFPFIEFTIAASGNYSFGTAVQSCATEACLWGTSVWVGGGEEKRLSAETRAALDSFDALLDSRRDMQWLRRVQKDYPVVRRQLVSLMADLDGRGASEAEAFSAVTSWSNTVGMSYLPQYLGRANDEAIEHFTRTVASGLEVLMEQSGTVCYDWMFGTLKFEQLPALSNFDTVAMNTVIGEVIESARSRARPLISDEAAEPLLEQVFEDMAERNGKGIVEDFSLFYEASPTDREKRRVCEVNHALYTSALQLPRRLRADLLRYLLTRTP